MKSDPSDLKLRGPGKSFQNLRTIAYWVCTFIIVFEMMAGGIWDLLRIQYVRVVLAHLGYPPYLLTILGSWKIPCAVVLLLPGFQRIKEWAYAGAVFNYTGAAASHFFAGYAGMGYPVVLAVITIVSWALRPSVRRLPVLSPTTAEQGVAAWIVPTLILIGLFVLSLVFLPKGGSPGS
jgi:hypothetical protein